MMAEPGLLNSVVIRSSVLLIAVAVGFAILDVTRPITAPIVLALVIAMILHPVHHALTRTGLAAFAASALILVCIAIFGFLAAFAVEPLVDRVAAQLPRLERELRGLLVDARAYLQGVEDLNAEIQEAVNPGGEEPAQAPPAAAAMPSMLDAALLAPFILGQVLIFLGTLFFALTCRHDLYSALARLMGHSGRLSHRITFAETRVAQYFGTITLINIGLGVVLGLVLAMLGMPLAAVWGAAATVLNFLLYLGPSALALALLLAGFVVFDGAWSFVPMLTYLLLNATEAQFVTPALVGRRMEINPLLVFTSVVFWLWFWGPVGGIIAIPLLVFWISLFDAGTEIAPDAEPGRPAEDPG